MTAIETPPLLRLTDAVDNLTEPSLALDGLETLLTVPDQHPVDAEHLRPLITLVARELSARVAEVKRLLDAHVASLPAALRGGH
ncbi:MAG: hypothetical protein J0M20_18055 [Burkholderiales bacterium]|nr:hypothetical protein [Burkholderiales bacterium]